MDKPLHKMTFTEMRNLATKSAKDSVREVSEKPVKKPKKKRVASNKSN